MALVVNDKKVESQQGFTLLELLLSILIFLTITSITFSLFSNSVRVSRSEITSTHRDEALKTALTLMASEIEQAGSHPDTTTPPPIIQGLATAGVNKTVTVTNAPGNSGNPLRGINVGDKLTIYDPATLLVSEKDVIVLSIDINTNSFKANLTQSHVPNSPIVSQKLPFRTGILSNSTGNKLRFFGDIFDDGQIYYIEYTYDPQTQRIYRAAQLATGLPATGAIVFDDKSLVRNMLINPSPNGTPIPVFQYVADDQGNITSVIITLTTGTGDFQEQRPLTLSSTVTARNVVATSTLTRTRDLSATSLPPTPNWINLVSMQR